jgi:hypothetical protein
MTVLLALIAFANSHQLMLAEMVPPEMMLSLVAVGKISG